jgi:O-antigen/teichoic acid export membrane protein
VKLTGKAKKYQVMLKELLDRPITRETGWVFVLKIAAAGLSFLVAVVLVRILGAEGYGIIYSTF